MEEINQKECPNCGSGNPLEANFCDHCGQKFQDSRIPFTNLVSTFVYSLFNADHSLWCTLRDIWIPGKITTKYFDGQRKSYFHPARLFFFSWVLFFGFFSLAGNLNIGTGLLNYNLMKDIEKEVEKKSLFTTMVNERDSLIASGYSSNGMADSLILYTARTVYPGFDGSNTEELNAFLLKKTTYKFDFVVDGDKEVVEVKYEDLIELSDEELLEKHEIEGFFSRLLAGQSLKMIRDTGGMIEYLIRGIAWSVFLVIPLMCLVQYFLYFYKNHYMVEHLVYYLHIHSFAFIILVTVRLLEMVIGGLLGLFSIDMFDLGWMYIIASTIAMIYPVVALRTFYKSSILGVIIKSWVLFSFYWFFVVLSFVLAVFVRFVLF